MSRRYKSIRKWRGSRPSAPKFHYTRPTQGFNPPARPVIEEPMEAYAQAILTITADRFIADAVWENQQGKHVCVQADAPIRWLQGRTFGALKELDNLGWTYYWIVPDTNFHQNIFRAMKAQPASPLVETP